MLSNDTESPRCQTLRVFSFSLAWAILIAFMTLMPSAGLPHNDSFSFYELWRWLTFDKLAHATVFSGLCFLLATSFCKQRHSGALQTPVMGVIAAILYSGLIEIAQLGVAGRSSDLADFIANSLGCVIGLIIWWWVYKV